jgi:hypothetical protein
MDGPFTMRSCTRRIRPTWLSGWRRPRPPRATPSIGELLLAPGVPATLDAGGFDRHTFLCGQSGSGKTYSLGLALERLLVETDLRLVILDPNSDYVRLGEQRTDADAQLAAGFAEAATGVVVRSAGTGLQLGVGELDPSARAAALALDPVADREEFALVDEMLGARVAFEELAKIRRAARAGASPPSREPRRSALGAVGPRPAWVARRRCRASRCPLSRRRSRLSGDTPGASRRRGGRARNALAAAGRSRARPRRDR